MNNIEIIEATEIDAEEISSLVIELLLELEPGSEDELKSMNIAEVTRNLMKCNKIFVLLAKDKENVMGIITMHECAAIYAGGLFGEISEFYVLPMYRCRKIGELLLESAYEKARQMQWQRIEVCSPPGNKWPRTVKFYESNGFICTGNRLRQLIL